MTERRRHRWPDLLTPRHHLCFQLFCEFKTNKQIFLPVHHRGKQTDSLYVCRAGRIFVGRGRGQPSLAGKLHSDHSYRWLLLEPSTSSIGEGVNNWVNNVFNATQDMLVKLVKGKVSELLTSSLIKYLRVRSFWDKRKILLRNCLLTLPFFHSVTSNRPKSEKTGKAFQDQEKRLEITMRTETSSSGSPEAYTCCK